MSFKEGVIRELVFLRNRLKNISSVQFNRQTDIYDKYLKWAFLILIKRNNHWLRLILKKWNLGLKIYR